MVMMVMLELCKGDRITLRKSLDAKRLAEKVWDS